MKVNLLNSKGQTQRQAVVGRWFTEEKANQYIRKVRNLQSGATKKKPEDYISLKRYDLVRFGNIDKLVVSGSQPPRFYITLSDLYSVMKKPHLMWTWW